MGFTAIYKSHSGEIIRYDPDTMETENGDYILDDRPIRFVPETFEPVFHDDPRYDSLPNFNRETGEFEYN